MSWYRRKKRRYTDVQMDAYITDHGLNPMAYTLAKMGHEPSQRAIVRYFEAKARTDERRANRKLASKN